MSASLDLRRYHTIVFDCDGVILNSNHIKTRAFFNAALPYGQPAAQSLVDYHVSNGGLSRYHKFEYFLRHIVGQEPETIALKKLLDAYAGEVRSGLTECEAAIGLKELRQFTPSACWLVVSGGDQQELRSVFAERGIAELFDGGIFGSPDTKDMILERENASGYISPPAVFLGDSRYDYQAALRAGMDFVFISKWTEVKDWPDFVANEGLHAVDSLADLLNSQT